MRRVFSILLIIYSLNAQSQTYRGTLGEYQIFLELDIDYKDNRATAFYFYQSQLKNISLDGNYNESELILFEKHSEEKDKKELFRLSIKGDKLFGTWQNGNTLLSVNLTKTEKKIDDFKLEKITFIRDSVSTYNKKKLVWFTEKHSKKVLFRLGNGFTKSQRKFINSKLDSIHTNYAIIGLECSWADVNIEIELISDLYLSFSEFSSIYCGGAHPNHNTSGYNFDLKNNIVLNKLTDIYPNLDHYQLLKKKYDSGLDIECEYFAYKEQWKYYSWVLTKKGVIITPLYPHAMTPCEIGFLLTFEELSTNIIKDK
ncbi:hypothetical protein [Tenacibaculum sp. SDUM215027]|uniref:hypothetical protein n=1 Tax=Tenacibaculum sp. SDUM215027 TaxID=3422596 RepID=UPI003D31B0EF